jgi:DNA replication initiation complex subunit (GINS family)
MYDELFLAWQYEIENEDLGSMAADFYSKISDYITYLKEENNKESTKTVKSSLLLHELNHVTCMVEELISARYNKLIKISKEKKKLPSENLSVGERELFSSFLSFINEYQLFRKNLFQGNVSKKGEVKDPVNRVTLRILKDIPALIGSDMKSYGPFLVEDVASLPPENAELLVKQGLGKLVETK